MFCLTTPLIFITHQVLWTFSTWGNAEIIPLQQGKNFYFTIDY